MPSKKGAWSYDETVKLVAYLDYYVKKRPELGNWSTDRILRELVARFKSRPSLQIRKKLFSLRGDQIPSSQKQKYPDVFKLGSRCLKQLSDRLRLDVASYLASIELNEENQRLHTPQTLRNGKNRSVSVSASRHSTFHGASVSTTPTPFPSTRASRAQIQHSVKTADEQTPGAYLLRPEANSNAMQGREWDLHIIKREASLNEGIGSPLTRTLLHPVVSRTASPVHLEVADSFESVPDDELDSCTEYSLDTDVEMTRRRLFGLDGDSPKQKEDHGKIVKARSKPARISSSKSWEMLRDLLEDSIYFRQKCLNLEQQLSDSKRDKRMIESLVARLSDGDPKGILLAQIHQQAQTIKKQAKSLEDQMFLQPYLQFSAFSQGTADLNKIKNAFEHIANALYSLNGIQAFQCSPEQLRLPKSRTLSPLISRAFGDTSILLSDETKITGSQLSRSIMQSLTGAAVIEWVFMPQLRCAALLSTSLLESYRNKLASLCRENDLRNLEFATYRSLLRDKDFQEIYLSRAAERLAETLLVAINGIGISDTPSEQSGTIRAELENVFFHALSIKYEAALCKDCLSILWPGAESLMDEHTMEPYRFDDGRILPCSRGGRAARVRMSIVPGLEVIEHERKSVTEPAFLSPGEYDEGKATPILRAIVSVK